MLLIPFYVGRFYADILIQLVPSFCTASVGEFDIVVLTLSTTHIEVVWSAVTDAASYFLTIDPGTKFIRIILSSDFVSDNFASTLAVPATDVHPQLCSVFTSWAGKFVSLPFVSLVAIEGARFEFQESC